jgi:hypothetical protein
LYKFTKYAREKYMRVRNAFAGSLLGALICAILVAVFFALGAMLDGARPGEAWAYAALVGIGGALLGGVIGFVVGVSRWGIIGGGIVGLVATLAVAALYVFIFGSPGRYWHFLNESRIIFVVLALPALLTGVATAALKTLLNCGCFEARSFRRAKTPGFKQSKI